MDADSDDRFQRAPFFLVPGSVINEMKSRLYLDEKVYPQVMFKIHGWTYDKINELSKIGDKDPLKAMFDNMCKYKPKCVITCSKPCKHFAGRFCYPIQEVYRVMVQLTFVAKMLDTFAVRKEVLKSVQERLDQRELYSAAREFQSDKDVGSTFFYEYTRKFSLSGLWNKLTSSRKHILVVDFITKMPDEELLIICDSREKVTADSSILEERQEFEDNMVENLIRNLSSNFDSCALTPTEIKNDWSSFVKSQFEGSTFNIALVSPRFVVASAPDSLNSPSVDGPSGSRLSHSSHRQLWSHMQQATVPAVAVTGDRDALSELQKLITPVFLLPRDMGALLAYIDAF